MLSGKRSVLPLPVRMASPRLGRGVGGEAPTRTVIPHLMRDLNRSSEAILIRVHLSYLCHLRAQPSSRVKHGMTALQQRLVVSGQWLAVSVSASLPHGHPALDAGSKSKQ